MPTDHFTVIRGISLAMKSADSRLKWSTLAKKAMADYNERPHGTTGYPAAFLQFGIWPKHCPFKDTTLEEARRVAVQRRRHRQQVRTTLTPFFDPSYSNSWRPSLKRTYTHDTQKHT
jgi:hypothetical protein